MPKSQDLNIAESLPDGLWSERNRLLMFAYRMIGQVEDAEDVLQDCLVKTIQFTESGGAYSLSWFYKVLSNACIDFIRRRGLQRGLLRIPENEYGQPGRDFAYNDILQPALDGFFRHEQTPEETWLAKEELHYALSLVAQFLPPKERAIYLMFELLQLSALEIGRLFNLSADAVYSRLKRARRRIEENRELAPPISEQTDLTFAEDFVGFFEAGDLNGLVSLFAPDGELNMPPYRAYFQGHAAIKAFLAPKFKTIDFRLVPVAAAGLQCYGLYENEKAERSLYFRGILLPFQSGGRLLRLTNFIYPELAPLMGLTKQL